MKLLKGNPGKRAINHDEPKMPPSGVTPPKGLSGRALTVWRDRAAGLVASGVLKISDRDVFRVYCELVADVEQFTALKKKVGPADAMRLGYAKRVDVLRKQLKEYSAVLGLNPSARSSLRVTEQKPGPDADAAFLRGDRGKKTG